jgi:hypothetical protein
MKTGEIEKISRALVSLNMAINELSELLVDEAFKDINKPAHKAENQECSHCKSNEYQIITRCRFCGEIR